MSNCCTTEDTDVNLPQDAPNQFISKETAVLAQAIQTAIIVPILFFIGGPANVINLGVFYRQGLGQRINLVLFCLAAVDLIYLTAVFVLQGERIFHEFTTQDLYGPVFRHLMEVNFHGFYGFLYASIFLYMIVACERCLCVVFPLHTKRILKTKVMAVVCVSGVLIIGFLRFVITARLHVVCTQTGTGNDTSCAFGLTDFGRKHKELIRILDSTLYGFILTVGSPVIVLIATGITTAKLYSAIKWRESATQNISRREMALTKTLIILSVVFFSLTVPSMAQRIVPVFVAGYTSTGRYRHEFAVNRSAVGVCSCLNSSVNFFVYFFSGTKYRDTLREMVGKQRSKQVHVSGQLPAKASGGIPSNSSG